MVKFITPKNEQGAIVLFSQLSEELGYKVVEVKNSCPDAILRKNGSDIRVEFEHVASNFRAHKHDPDKVDLIICWQDDWPQATVPVFSLQKYLLLREPPPVPQWKVWLDTYKEWRIYLIERLHEIRLVRTKRRKTKTCKICGGVMVPSCKSYIYDCDVDDDLRCNEVIFECAGCGFTIEDWYYRNPH